MVTEKVEEEHGCEGESYNGMGVPLTRRAITRKEGPESSNAHQEPTSPMRVWLAI